MKPPTSLLPAITTVVVFGMSSTALTQENLAERSATEMQPPFSGQANVEYARALWRALETAKLVGPDAIVTYPYEGTPPHGKVLEYLEAEFTFAGHTDTVIVKKNYAGDGDVEELEHTILNDRMQHLDSVTVMFRREEGYDSDNQNWFWGKYAPSGAVATNPKGMALAGRVAKGADQGCIACHQAAEGRDYIYSHDKFAK